MGRLTRSAPTFYKHAKRVGIERYWRHEFSIRNMLRIIESLGIDDAVLSAQLARVAELRTQRQDFELELTAGGFA